MVPLVALLAVVPCLALADVGTPLVWAGAFHMLIGNALLGWLEAALLRRAFGREAGRCLLAMVAANYFSGWVGTFLVDALRQQVTVDLYNAVAVTWLLVFVLYLLTLLIEWPFVAFCLRRSPRWLLRSVQGSFLAQTTSYVLLFGGFWLVSTTSLYRELSLVPPGLVSLPRGVHVVFIEGDTVYRRADGEKVTVGQLPPGGPYHLRLQTPARDAERADLLAQPKGGGRPLVVVKGFAAGVSDEGPFGYGGWGSAPRIGAAAQSTWRFSWAHWPAVGIYGEDEKARRKLQFAFGVPLMGWHVWRVIHLPEEKLLVQLGSDQLCLLDVVGRRIALWERGRGPVAVTDDQLVRQADPADTGGPAPP